MSMSMSDDSLDEGVALVLGKVRLVAESENMTACEYDLLGKIVTACCASSRRYVSRRAR